MNITQIERGHSLASTRYARGLKNEKTALQAALIQLSTKKSRIYQPLVMLFISVLFIYRRF